MFLCQITISATFNAHYIYMYYMMYINFVRNRQIARVSARFNQVSIDDVEVGGVSLPKVPRWITDVERFLNLVPEDWDGTTVLGLYVYSP